MVETGHYTTYETNDGTVIIKHNPDPGISIGTVLMIIAVMAIIYMIMADSGNNQVASTKAEVVAAADTGMELAEDMGEDLTESVEVVSDETSDSLEKIDKVLDMMLGGHLDEELSEVETWTRNL